MAGIPIYTSSPINPNHATTGMVPTPTATQTPNSENQTVPAPVSATQTSAGWPNTRAPLPGAAPGPAPTRRASSSLAPELRPTPTSALSPSRTRQSPPAPRPGASPIPWPPSRPLPISQASIVPPPPRAGEAPKSAEYYAPSYQPEQTANIQRQPGIPGPTPALDDWPPAPLDLSHPPGYIQNARASFEERSPSYSVSDSHPYDTHGLLGNESRDSALFGETGLWATAVSWAKAAGEKLLQGEEEIWKVINKDR